METWIKLYRKFSDWEWYKSSETLHLFIHLLLNANHKDGSWRGVVVKRGQMITGRKQLAEKTGISEQSLRTSLKRLKLTCEITISSTNKYSIITICNYNKYQGEVDNSNPQNIQQTNQQVTSKKPTANHKQEDKNGNNGKIKELYPTVEEVKKYCFERNNSVDPVKWVDYYTANGWRVGSNPMKDWRASVRTWEKNVANNNKPEWINKQNINSIWDRE